MKLFAGSNFRESSVASIVLTYCPNCSRDVYDSRKLGLRENLVVYSIGRVGNGLGF
ncbi:MAG: hypothetical protein PV344_04760 [Anaplasma sp.]|nr:hypothetical protein [Anaplasma sp.]